MRLVSDETVSQVLSELKEYSAEVDLEFVRQAIQAIGTCAIQFRDVERDSVTILPLSYTHLTLPTTPYV